MSTPKPQNFTSGYQMNLASTPNPRLADLAKMRSKLATSQPQAIAFQQKQLEKNIQWTLNGMGYALSAGAILTLVFLISWASLANRDTTSPAAKKVAQVLFPPGENRSIDDQALYWAYALYDFRKLVSTFGVSPTALIDTDRASSELNHLLPKASAGVQLQVMKYRNQLVRKIQ